MPRRPVTPDAPASALLTTGEAAALLKVAADTVRRLVYSGRLPAVNIGSTARPRLRIRSADVDAFLHGCEVRPTMAETTTADGAADALPRTW